MAKDSQYKSTQKLPKHHSFASQTQDSIDPTSDTYSGNDNVNRGGKQYRDGAKAGSGGAKSDPDGPAPAAQPKKQTF